MTLHEEITQHLKADPKNVIAISTMTRHTIYKAKHVGLFEAPTRPTEIEGVMAGVYVRHGKRRDFALAYQVRFGRMSKKEHA